MGYNNTISNNTVSNHTNGIRVQGSSNIVANNTVFDSDDAGKGLLKIADKAFKVPEKFNDLGEMPQKEVHDFIKDIQEII